MDKKIAFFDIDGTIVNVHCGMLHPSKETIRVLKEFKRQGNYIVIATARGMVPSSISDIDFDGYICCDGHYIEFNDEVLVDNLFNEIEIKKQLEIYQRHNGECIFGGHYGQWFSDKENELIKKHQLMFGGSYSIDEKLVINDNNISDVKANTITAIFNSASDLYNARKELPDDYAIVAYDQDHIRMDVHLPGFSKGTACKYVYEYLKIKPENTYAFGDGINDIEMLQLITHSIAMGNASMEVKEHASEVTTSVDDEGIARAFKKHFDI